MKRLHINIRTEDVFHPVDKLGTFCREQMRTFYLRLNAIGNRAASCSAACEHIPKHLSELGLDNMKISPVHLKNYYDTVESLCAEMSDAVANRLTARGDLVTQQDNYIRKIYGSVSERACDLGDKQWSGVRKDVIESLMSQPIAGLDDDELVPEYGDAPCGDHVPNHGQYMALVSTGVLAEALRSSLQQFNFNSKGAMIDSGKNAERREARLLLDGVV